MEIVCFDMEGTLTPEIWEQIALNTGIEDFNKTTRDIPDYSDLMDFRLNVMKQHNLKLSDIQKAASELDLLDGAEEFLKRLFDVLKLPELLESEEKLRQLWSNPITRNELLKKLESAGCHKEDLIKLQEMINAENSDLFDVLEYIAYAKTPVSREARVETNKDNIYNLLNEEQQEFVAYVLRNYINVGVDELDVGKLSTVLTAKYGSINEAQKKLGSPQEIQNIFVEFQQKLYG